ncbi:hypothetical protein [Pelagibaculum spongiae]|uniref:NHL repeat containing protein n=1 Tax=Pelagibaculum spongiae TaxID=2080658 RepID=A0A2V1H082_9GAMM|nr:hypothetical protein [Pelagibaculum spongiae]PVZ72079.1 hypothetical protein DC094_03410 [Pelagibaculum spongiae]
MKRISNITNLPLVIVFSLLLSGCLNNGNDIPIVSMPSQGQVIARADNIELQFGNSILTGSVEISGELQAEAAAFSMASREMSDDTIIISPATSWSVGGDRKLVISAKDVSGNASKITLSINILLVVNNQQAASVVIGQDDFVSANYLSSTLNGTHDARSVDTSYGNPLFFNNYLYLPDYEGDRVLIFDGIPTSNSALASAVLGQSDFDESYHGSGAADFDGPQQIASSGTQFFIVDYENHRVVVYNQQPLTTDASADLVLGQSSFGPNNSSCAASTLDDPESVFATENLLFVADADNHRVLIWNLPITQNGQPANLVLGQVDFTHCDLNTGEDNVNRRGMSNPTAVWSDGNRIVVLDTYNNRALIWNKFPTQNNQAADLVLGQENFTDNDANTGISGAVINGKVLSDPYNGLDSNGLQLCIADKDNNRVLIWNEFPTSNFQAADRVLGQQDLTLSTLNDANGDSTDDTTPSAQTLNEPKGCYFSNDKLLVNDMANSRWLIYQSQ